MRIVEFGNGETARETRNSGLDGAHMRVEHDRLDAGIGQESQKKGKPDRVGGAQKLPH